MYQHLALGLTATGVAALAALGPLISGPRASTGVRTSPPAAVTAPARQLAPSRPVVSLAPHRGEYVNPSQCVAECFDATASYTTPAYVSLDVARSVTLLYRSSSANAFGTYQLDVSDTSAEGSYGLQVMTHYDAAGHWLRYSNQNFFLWTGSGKGTMRVVARVELPGSRCEAFPWTFSAHAALFYGSGTSEAVATKLRVLAVDERCSKVGAGWTIAGMSRLRGVAPDTLVLWGADGEAGLYVRAWTEPNRQVYASPAGDLSVVTQENGLPDGASFARTFPDSSRLGYNGHGYLVWARDRFGNATRYGYNTATYPWQLTSITDPAGLVTTLAYDANGFLRTITDPMGRVTQVTVVPDPANPGRGTLTQIVDPAERPAFRAEYQIRSGPTGYLNSSAYLMTRRYDAAGNVYTYAYDYMWKLAADTMPAVQIEGQGLVKPVVRYTSVETASNPYNTPSGNFQPRYGPEELFASVTNPRGYATRFRLNPLGWPTRIEEPLGRVAQLIRDAHGRVITAVAPSGHTVDYTYTGVDLTRMSNRTTGEVITMTYEPVYHQLTSSTNGVSGTWYSWSGGKLDWMEVGQQGPSNRTSFVYESINGRLSGRVTSVTDPRGHSTTYAYHTTGTRNLYSVSAAGRTETYGYDAFGRVATTTAPDGAVTQRQYDILNRDTLVIGPIVDTTITRYNSLFVTAIRDAKGQLYQFVPNALGWVERRIDPVGLSETFGYDLNGNVLRQTNRRGQSITIAYDNLDNVSARSADGGTTTYATDPLDRFIATGNAEGVDTVKFDVAGRKVSEISVRTGRRYERASVYDARGFRTALQVVSPWTASVGYRYDAKMRLDMLTGFDGAQTVITHNDDGQPATITLPTSPATVVTRSFPANHAPSEIAYNTAALDDELGMTYGYNSRGTVHERIDRWTGNGRRGRRYSYDKAGRLTGFVDFESTAQQYSCPPGMVQDVDPTTGSICWTSSPGGEQTLASAGYTYDKVGNRTDAGALAAPGNRLVRFSGDSLVYDGDGNLRKRIRAGAEVQRLYWNSLGQLVAAWTSGADSVSFGYDGWGRRVRKSWPSGAFLRYIHDGDDLLAEEDHLWNIVEYAHYPGVDQPHSFRQNLALTYYYAADHPGNVVGVLDGSGALVGRYRYGAFGIRESFTGWRTSAYQFGARELDEETGLYYNRARYYDPRLARFVSEDPIGLEGGINLYAYAGNDPVNFVEPFGLEACTAALEAEGWQTVTFTREGGTTSSWCYKPGGGQPLPGVVVTAPWNPTGPPASPGLPAMRGPGGGGAGGRAVIQSITTILAFPCTAALATVAVDVGGGIVTVAGGLHVRASFIAAQAAAAGVRRAAFYAAVNGGRSSMRRLRRTSVAWGGAMDAYYEGAQAVGFAYAGGVLDDATRGGGWESLVPFLGLRRSIPSAVSACRSSG